MSEIVKYTIDKKDLLNLLSNYCSKSLGHTVVVKERHGVESIGFYETEAVNVHFSFEEDDTILGAKVKKEVSISRESIESIIKEELKKEGYDLMSLYYDCGTRCTDFYEKSRSAYFNGIKIEARKEKEMSLVMKG